MHCLWLLLVLVATGCTIGELPPPEMSYKILMLLPASSKSHRNVFMPVAEGLADRGHQIVMLSNHDKPSRHPNIQEIFHGLPHFRTDDMNMFKLRESSILNVYKMLSITLSQMARDIYHLPKVKELFDKRKEFDLIIIDSMFNELAYPFVYKMPFITISITGLESKLSAIHGNPLNPSYVPCMHHEGDLSTVFGRFLNLIFHIQAAFRYRIWDLVPAVQNEISVLFPDLPPLLEIERNQSLTLMNSQFSLDRAVPILPSQIEVGGMHCRPANPLPEDLKSWIEGAGSAGVVYFSLGSIARGDTMPVKYRSLFLEAFRQMDQRVLWKFEGQLGDIPKNVLIKGWLPQQDILAHPNVKVFITHAGLLSIQEASYHATPVITIPIFGDQPKNGENVAAKKLGINLVWEELTVNMIKDSLLEIIQNPKYGQNMASVSKAYRDQIDTPKERAIFWTEYVIRHKGAVHLRSPAAQLSWVKFLMLDIAAVSMVGFFVILLILQRMFKITIHVLCNGWGKKKKRD